MERPYGSRHIISERTTPAENPPPILPWALYALLRHDIMRGIAGYYKVSILEMIAMPMGGYRTIELEGRYTSSYTVHSVRGRRGSEDLPLLRSRCTGYLSTWPAEVPRPLGFEHIVGGTE